MFAPNSRILDEIVMLNFPFDLKLNDSSWFFEDGVEIVHVFGDILFDFLEVLFILDVDFASFGVLEIVYGVVDVHFLELHLVAPPEQVVSELGYVCEP